MYRCKHFKIHELVPRKMFEDLGESAWEQLDVYLLITLDRLRKRYGRMTVNNYYWGGAREWSGKRTPDSPYYSETSQHSSGRAADCLFSDHSANDVRKSILKDPESRAFEYIGSIELGTSWLHFDVRNVERIKTYWP